MEKIKYILILIITGCVLWGCSDDFLQEHPKDEMYADNLFVDYKGFTLAKHALLEFPRIERTEPIQSAELGVLFKIGTDVAWANSNLSWLRGIDQYNVELNSTMQFLNGETGNTDTRPGVFLILYRAINSANVMINRAENPEVDWQGADEEEDLANKNEIIAHAKLIRSWAYRHLVMGFGPVPLNVEEITGETYRDDWERNSVEEIQALMEEDWLFAEQWLPDNSNDVIRLSSAIASHYLAELYLWQGRNEEAEAKARAVIENPNYKLITARYGVKASQSGNAFMDQFYNGNIMPSEGNTEALWVFPNTEEDNVLGQSRNTMRRTWISAYYNLNIDISPEYGGRGLGRAAITSWVFSLYESQDDRFSEYAIRKRYVTKTGSTITTQMSKAGMTMGNHRWASTRKWDWDYDDRISYYSFADQTYLRIAETYLLLAESLHLQGKNSESDGAAYYINQIRTRSNATPITASDVSIDYILDERARELITEEQRRHTLVRTGKLVERTRLYNHIASGERDGGNGIQDYHVRLPLPQKVIDANVGRVMEQNEGY